MGDAGHSRSKRGSGSRIEAEPYGAELRLTQSLYAGGRTQNSVKQAESIVDVRRAELMTIENRIFANAAIAYLDVVRDEAQLDLTRNNEKVLERQLEASKDRFEVGEVTRTDVAQSEARLSRAVADRVTAEGNLAISRATYQRTIGNVPKQLEPVPDLPTLPQSRQDAIDGALDNNPQLIAAKFAEEAAGHATEVAFSAACFPRSI